MQIIFSLKIYLDLISLWFKKFFYISKYNKILSYTTFFIIVFYC